MERDKMLMGIRRKLTMLAAGLCMALCFVSCKAPVDYNYFQDLTPNELVTLAKARPITIKPQDELNIVVETKDPQLRMAYNKTLISEFDPRNMNAIDYMINYVVDEEGTINFPYLGKVKLEGMTRREAELYIEKELRGQKLVNDASVTVSMTNRTFNVMGEVQRPGTYAINKDNYTLLDAISAVGDLTTYGVRSDIQLIRQEGGSAKVFNIDLTQGKQLLQSPAFYVQQGDVIYVKANKTRQMQSTTNGSQTMTYSFWISLASVIVTLGVVLFK